MELKQQDLSIAIYPEIMTRAEAAAYLRCEAHTIDNLRRKGVIPVFYIGADPRFEKAKLIPALEAWNEKKRTSRRKHGQEDAP